MVGVRKLQTNLPSWEPNNIEFVVRAFPLGKRRICRFMSTYLDCSDGAIHRCLAAPQCQRIAFYNMLFRRSGYREIARRIVFDHEASLHIRRTGSNCPFLHLAVLEYIPYSVIVRSLASDLFPQFTVNNKWVPQSTGTGVPYWKHRRSVDVSGSLVWYDRRYQNFRSICFDCDRFVSIETNCNCKETTENTDSLRRSSYKWSYTSAQVQARTEPERVGKYKPCSKRQA
jgi:hypothetical protein